MLLEWAEIEFEVIVKHADEDYPAGLAFPDVAMYIANKKAEAVKAYVKTAFHGQMADRTILAADTIVVLDNEVIGKPDTRKDAINTLTRLSGRTHEVITGVAIHHAGGQEIFSDTTQVKFHPLTAEQISFYVDKYEPYDKAGAYAIQEWIGVVGIASVTGDFYNVMGLPVSRVVQALQHIGQLK